MRRRLGAILGTVLAVTVVSPVTSPAHAADDERLAFLRENSEFGWELVVTDGQGGTPVTITTDAVGRPALSPDGTRIAYAAPVGDGTLGKFAIFVSRIDGSQRTRLTKPALGDRDPAWSPDGRWIAFSRNVNDDLNGTRCCAIRIIRSDGTGLENLSGSRGGRNPAWSPDGTRIAYETPSGIFVADRDTGDRVQLAGQLGAEPAWSPDGSTVAYTRPLGNGSELVTRPAAGGDFTVRVSSSDLMIESPVWGSDNRTIYYVRHRGVGYGGRSTTRIVSHTPGSSPRVVLNPGGDIAHLSRVQRSSRGCDFDGDGYDDLAIGAPGDNTGAGDAGSVTVLAGDAAGLSSGGAVLWSRSTPGISGPPRAGARLGSAIACGDFDGDGFSDLAAGAPGDRNGRGTVMVLLGSASGLTNVGDQLWEQDTPGIPSISERDDAFGAALASGDFDGDGFSDLAIGVPGEGSDHGAVHVLYGSGTGLSANGDLYLRQGAAGVDGTRTAGDEFGAALATGDFDGDGYDELVVGTPGEVLAGKTDSGSILVIAGSASGLDTGADAIWHQDTSGVEGAAEAGDRFGAAVTTGDFDGDGYDDLAVGAPDEDQSALVSAGSVHVIYGSNDGLTAVDDVRLFQGSAGLAGVAQSGDRFGAALTAADFDGDGFFDLAIGSPDEADGEGVVNVLYGSATGVDGARDHKWRRDHADLIGAGSKGDRWGAALTSGDYDGDGFADLAIGIPGANSGGSNDSGGTHILYGTSNRLTALGDQLWHQDRNGIPGASAAGDEFGGGLR